MTDIKTVAPGRKSKSNAALMAELNAELRERDPNEVLRRRVRNATLDELETRAKADLAAVAETPPARRILRIIADMRAGA
jgi:hypothetical protein